MAGGWSRDGAEQEQIEATVNDALQRARQALPMGDSAEFCEECDQPIARARQLAIPGVQHCVSCQSKLEAQAKKFELFNRRGSKDSQLR
ncbi:DksA/TraR family C4-type zinc finger protein [Alkanindiges sp. WGS2144]|uniref:DksA/TraR family C4-type zinc finger protein n=1 Tax=Alkanindiges sp. WGS2144 TaxID=3366808 RepID=UPI0037535CEA